MDLFDYRAAKTREREAPLADRLRPERFEEFFGQQAVVGEGSVLRTLIESDQVPSMLFWGPPGTGKTTLARLVARHTSARFVQLSAVTSGLADLRAAVEEAREALKMRGFKTIVFIDEIHRWNRSQQDAFLPVVEDGTVTLIGATTENPSFAVISALLSRCRVFVFAKLEAADIVAMLRRAIVSGGFAGLEVVADDTVLSLIAEMADGDGRVALNALEIAVRSAAPPASQTKTAVKSGDAGARTGMVHLNEARVAEVLKRSHLLYDKRGEEHYNIISALHKSMRGSDADASLYWLGRMLESGEDPRYVARRLIRFASEDIGLADSQALVQAVAAFDAVEKIGMPECNVNLAQAVAYLARAPKSIAIYRAMKAVQADITRLPNEPVPLHLRNAPTRLMKDLGFGKDYVYPPTAAAGETQDYLPEKLRGKKYLA